METASQGQLTLHDGLSIKLVPAPVLKRVFAYVVDLSLVTGVIYLAFIVYMMLVIAISAAAIKFSSGGWIMLILIGLGMLAILIFYHGYFIYYEKKRGFTPGKKLFGLKVVSLDGQKLTMRQCVLRDMMRYIDCMLVVPGLVSINLNSKKQRLGDMLCDTMVTHSPRQESTVEYFYIDMQQYEYLLSTLLPTNLPKEKMDGFIKFAYAFFITKSVTATPEQVADYTAYFLSFCQGNVAVDISGETLLRFFAEYGLKKL